MSADRLNYGIYSKKQMGCMFRTNVLDEYSILKFEGEIFIIKCYRWMLNRDVDDTGYKAYTKLLKDGYAKEGVIYLLSQSEEFNNRFEIHNINRYKKIYLKSKVKVKIKKIIHIIRNKFNVFN